jgi:hypothetical protein
LNLVLNDGTRYHLVAYVSRRRFERDASTLARLLERVTIALSTPLGRCEFTPLYPPFVREED